MTGDLPPMDDAGACPECGCLPGDWDRPADGQPSYAETRLRHCECDCHPPEVRDRMRAFGARAYRPSPLDELALGWPWPRARPHRPATTTFAPGSPTEGGHALLLRYVPAHPSPCSNTPGPRRATPRAWSRYGTMPPGGPTRAPAPRICPGQGRFL